MEVLMHFIRVGEDSSPEDLAEAACHLRERQLAETDPAIRRWLAEDIDDCLDLWSAAVKVPH